LSAFLSGPLGFAGGVRWMEEYAFLNGTGAGQPLGVITAINTPTIAVNRAAANAVSYADFANMMERFLPSGRGVWHISQSLMSDVIQLNGPAGNPSYVWASNAADGIPGTLLGLPVIWTEKVPRVGTTGDVVLADWRYYLLGDRQATTIESTKFDRWAYDETSWRVVHRVDGQPWMSAPLTYQDGTTSVSPFVVLSSTVDT
jgi:HK97 family phage major capsid protein